jgi:hypothetical protein
VKSGGVPARKVEDKDKTKDKDAKLKEQKEMAALFKPVQKVDKGTSPLSSIFKSLVTLSPRQLMLFPRVST